LTRGDIQYVVIEYGQAYLHGKNIRERAMSLIAIAHPKFRSWLIEEAKKLSLIYKDQAFIPGKKASTPSTWRHIVPRSRDSVFFCGRLRSAMKQC